MLTRKTLTAAGVLVLGGALAGCGHSGSSGSGGGSPTDASKTSFCDTFDKLTTKATPKKAADTLAAVGTPSDIGTAARRGFEVLVDRLRQLPEDADKGDITHMAGGLSGSDQADVTAFISYYASECEGVSTAPPS